MKKLWRSLNERVESWVVKLYFIGAGEWLRWGSLLFVAAYPVLLDSDLGPDRLWLRVSLWIIWFLGFLSYTALQAYKRPREMLRLQRELKTASAMLGGIVEDLARKQADPKKRGLGNQEAKQSCIALLHRVRDIVEAAMDATEADSIRATLAVPRSLEDGEDGLGVWCYDQPYDNRNFTQMQMEWEGAPAAYRTGNVAFIPDMHDIDYLPDASTRPFRSVVSIPVTSSKGKGLSLAVVSVDAKKPDFFDPNLFIRDVLPYVLPAIQLVGLVLATRRKSSDYDFPS